MNVLDLQWNGKALCPPCWSTVCNYSITMKVTSKIRNLLPAVLLNCAAVSFLYLSVMFLLLFLPAGGGYWRKSAPGDGGCTDGPGQGRSAGLCLAGKPQQWGSLHREPPETLQRKPHLCNEANFLHNIVTKQLQLVWWGIFWMRSNVLAQTYIGSVLVSVNPYKELEMYSKQQMERYRGVSFYEISPHMWVASWSSDIFSFTNSSTVHSPAMKWKLYTM